MACAAQIFSNVSSEAWTCLKSKAAEQGVTIGGDSGAISKSGFTIQYAYDAGARTLSLTCTDKPFIFSCATVNGKIHELIEGTGCLGSG